MRPSCRPPTRPGVNGPAAGATSRAETVARRGGDLARHGGGVPGQCSPGDRETVGRDPSRAATRPGAVAPPPRVRRHAHVGRLHVRRPRGCQDHRRAGASAPVPRSPGERWSSWRGRWPPAETAWRRRPLAPSPPGAVATWRRRPPGPATSTPAPVPGAPAPGRAPGAAGFQRPFNPVADSCGDARRRVGPLSRVRRVDQEGWPTRVSMWQTLRVMTRRHTRRPACSCPSVGPQGSSDRGSGRVEDA